jgi:hypothetical protein
MRLSFDTSEPLEDVVDVLERVYGVQITIERTRGRSRHDKVAAPATNSAEPSGGTETT